MIGVNMGELEATAREFDAKAATYESNRLAPWYQAHGESIIEHLSLRPGDVVLDVGCGTGHLLRRIAGTWPEVRGIGVDLAPRMVEVARAKTAAEGLVNLTFVQADWERPSPTMAALLAERPATTIVCANTFHYFVDSRAAMYRMHAALAPGGMFLLLERDKEHSPLTVVWDYAHRFLVRDNARFYNSIELLGALNAAGFCDTRVVSRFRRMLWKNKLYTSMVLMCGRKAPA